MARTAAEGSESTSSGAKRNRLSQTDVPAYSLEQALRIGRAIAENYGYKPTPPLHVAKALKMAPNSSYFRQLAGASIAYGITNGGCNAEQISLEPLGMRIVRPTVEGDDIAAKREALLRPRVIREFLQKYDGAPVPKPEIACNVLEELGVPSNRTEQCLQFVLEGAQSLNFLQVIKDRTYVDLRGTNFGGVPAEDCPNEEASPASMQTEKVRIPLVNPAPPATASMSETSVVPDRRSKRVFITHGKNTNFIEPIRKLLSFGELEAVVSTDKQTVSQPVPLKVMEDMRSCGAAIIHVSDERHLVDDQANEHIILNENVLIEIGAAMALYGQRFVLVVKDGITLPSNLQGLYEVRYVGDTLDGNATIKLLEAINDLKKRPLPKA